MSFDQFFLRFDRGESVPLDKDAFLEAVAPFVVRTEPDVGFLLLRARDGGEADVYASLDEEPFYSFMVNHVSPGDMLDLLVALARATDTVIVAPGCSTAVTRPEQRRHLPDGLGDDVALVRTGEDLGAVIAAG